MSDKLGHRRAQKLVSTVLSPIERFLQFESASGIILILVTILTMIWANSPWADSYFHLIETPISLGIGNWSLELSLHAWVNDALMVIFFFVVGLEIKRELVMGELATPRKAALPLFAALGGMVCPALIYSAFNLDGPGHSGWGIPMATDIAFAVGVLLLMGKKVPFPLKVFLLALAIADDLGAVSIIGFFYTSDVSQVFLLFVALGILIVAFIKYLGVRKIPIYTILGVLIWFAILRSGIHATIAGVILGLMTPAKPFLRKKEAPEKIKKLVDDLDNYLEGKNKEGNKSSPVLSPATEYLDEKTKGMLEELHQLSNEARSPLDRLVYVLHPIVSFAIMPIFAIVNTGISLAGFDFSLLMQNHISLGIILGLMVGKPIGILLFSWLAVRTNLAQLPRGVTWYHMTCVGCLGGIGFTMALFISHIALKTPDFEIYSKLGILVGSFLSAVFGISLLGLAKDSQPRDISPDFGRE